MPLVFSVSFVVIFGGVVVFGHRESVGKLKKNKDFVFFFTMKQSRLKIMEKVFIFFFFCGSACCDFVWLPRKYGKVEKK